MVMGYWNVHGEDEDFISWHKELGLNDAIREHVSPKVSPPTYDRGFKSINTILATNGIVIDKGVYLPFGEGVGDYRAKYLDLRIQSILGTNIPDFIEPQVRHLQMKDPCIVKTYTTILGKYFGKHKLCERIAALAYIEGEKLIHE